ncbi:MAG TPA: polyprenyl diphosphate synthase, partial [Promineifilum sp.]|nr:polyprenyl diphosphate synthase [Promineifilum sp.]
MISRAARNNCKTSPTHLSPRSTRSATPKRPRSWKSRDGATPGSAARSIFAGCSSPCSDHHGRQRPLGAQAGLPRQAGHRAGAENLRRIIRACVEFNIKVLTIYAFSTENWGRPKSEVQAFMKIFARVLDQETDELNAQGVCVHHLGDLTGVDPRLQEKVRRALELTRDNNRLILNVAFNYGGRAEIIHAVRQMLADDIRPEELNEALFSSYLFTKGLPDPDLVIRTSGELR